MPNHDGASALHEIINTHLPALSCVDIKKHPIKAAGHRIVHGGPDLTKPTLINPDILQKIKDLIPLAPLHNPGGIEGIEAVTEALPGVPQVACFDTAFHHTIPLQNQTYPLPYDLANRLKIQRYGFHGISVEYVYRKACVYAGLNQDLRTHVLVLHLGSGCSVTAVKNGRSVGTTMGLTPMEGVAMMTRAGSIDTGIVQYIGEQEKISNDEVFTILNKKSGILGISGKSDLREVIEYAGLTHPSKYHQLLAEVAEKYGKDSDQFRSQLAVEVFVQSIAHATASMYIDMGRVDVVAFTGGVGQNSPVIRAKIMEKFRYRGWRVDPALNELGGKRFERLEEPYDQGGIISHDDSSCQCVVVHTDEEKQIEMHTKRVLGME